MDVRLGERVAALGNVSRIDNEGRIEDTYLMSSLALEIDRVMRRLAAPKALRLERLLRDGLALALSEEADDAKAVPVHQHQDWLLRLNALRNSVGTGKAGTSTEAILDDLRSERA